MPEEIMFVIEGLSTLWKISIPYLLVLKTFIVQFWWIPVPFYLIHHLDFIYDLYITGQWLSDKSKKRVVLEIKIPKTILRPLKAMEAVFASFWGTYDPPSSWKEKHFKGKTILGASFELAGIDGVPHFFVRLPSSNRKLFESAVYSQYSEVEIIEVPDYTKQVPEDIPNKEWDLWGCDFELIKPDVYPLRTYEEFYEEKPDSSKEEKRIDPLSHLFETIARTQKGEQLWFSIFIMPRGPKDTDFFDRARKEVDKLAKRPEKKEGKPLLVDFWNLLVEGRAPEEEVAEKEDAFLPPEMKLTTGERDVVSAIERKKSKNVFLCFIKYVYVAKRKVFYNGAKGFGTSFFSQFGTQNLNSMKPWGMTTTKVHSPSMFTARKLYLRKRDLVENYRTRDPAFDPFNVPGATYTLNTEELATMYHFPSSDAVPSSALQRMETKKGAPPAQLPVE
ncbi:MAG: hypothetical protein WC998_02485 [Candidatus Paceibacterota bacterium]|jgi:hypothetical protein